MTLRNNCSLHCVNVEKVYDWIIVPLQFTTCIEIPKVKKRVTDEFCGNFTIASNGQINTLWESTLPAPVAGSVSLSVAIGNISDVIILINGTPIETGSREQFTQSFSSLRSVAIINKNPLLPVRGRYCLTLHYALFRDLTEDLLNCREEGCYLANECGESISFEDVICKEIGDRKDTEIILPNGKRTVLQKIHLCKQGCIGLTYDKGRQCCVFPFYKVEQLLLCAPEGTTLQCEVTDFSCRISSITNLDNCWRLEISIEICQSIQVTANTTLEIKGINCSPRPVISDIDCNKIHS
ncbi:MAG: S-Ena type endospore appendage [Halobacillus sp.]|uniref:S-Ena type endospore appendage n=1 Tax=Halobacillus sp. TaxID=56800 RepID=UPI003BB1053D